MTTPAHHAAAESGAAMVAKLAPPATMSLATIAGMDVSELVLWATLIYTALMIMHKLVMVWRDIFKREK